jgi:enolase-phosphatase E1
MILLDIEGTTTPLAFVKHVLYPYARANLRSYLDRHQATPRYAALMAAFHAEHAADERGGEPVGSWAAGTDARQSLQAYAEWLMDRDRKSTPLKELQGYIWEEGYQRGELVGQVFDDVPRAFARWRGDGVRLGIFSSGAVLAQQWLFRRSAAGDLSSFIHWYFDTRTGAKQDPGSYGLIAAQAGEPAAQIVFVSDVVGELNAARGAGMATVMMERPGNAPQPPHDHPVVRSLEGIGQP